MTDTQTILIAGATGNIGIGAAVALTKRGARVVLLGRKLERIEARADSIRAALSEAQIDYQDTDIATLVIDFSDMESVRLAAAEALNRFPTVNGLILSVVCHIQNGPNLLPSGHEVMFATNVMGPFLFTQLLLERMQQSDGLRLPGRPLFYVMPYVEWDTLKNRLDREQQLPVNEAVKIAMDVAEAHEQGVIHRDIKPGNILISRGKPLISDFGIVLALSSAGAGERLTETGLSLGTPYYMSPEQATGDPTALACHSKCLLHAIA